MPLDDASRRALLVLARRSIEDGFSRPGPAPPQPPETLPEPLRRPGATFVTLRQGGRLRGCRGALEAVRPVAHDVAVHAWASAFDDPRFPPLRRVELESLEISVCLLSGLESLVSASATDVMRLVEPGRHGLVLACGPRRATFLPQVWQSLPDAREFIAELMEKAGLPRDTWPARMQAWRYTVESFGEVD